jgi:S1-C subfamily serine protease
MGSPTRLGAPTRSRPSRLRLRLGLVVATITAGSFVLAAPALAAPVSGASPSDSGSGAASGSDVSGVASKIDPAVVDINTTLANGAAAGTGMIIGSSGEVLTNNHVINGATSISVQVAGTGASHPAKVVGYDASDDVAVLRIEGVSNLPTVTTSTATVNVGQPVVAIGNALGRGGTPATAAGTVTALGQTITATDDNGSNPETLTGAIQVDAAIQPGDSGGPLVNANGQVIGMDSAGSNSQSNLSASTDGFAIPIGNALTIAHQIESGKSDGTITVGVRAILGAQVQDNTAPGGSTDPNASGVAVAGVESGSPADRAGLTAGDTIVSLNGKSISSIADLSAAMGSHHPGDKVSLGWIDSSGQQNTATVQLIAGPPV